MERLELLVPPHKGSLSLEHNPHFSCNETIDNYLGDLKPTWVEGDKEQAISNNEIWIIHWYPETSVSFYVLAASTFDNLMKLVKSV